ncbi:hypothetical protein [Burkholderia savannae]|uniref:hypothetical protein n=1 Tax=Burkholderia savannae TaxID=1637837 RepID=UPI0009EC397C|nr:hypothetical protein [Burkholderia savannae]
MKLSDIKSAAMPEIDESVKECVNLGRWLLFKSEAKSRAHAEAVFYLKTGVNVFELSESGRILQKLNQGEEDLEIDELFYFSDLPRPGSLSNSVCASVDN